MSDDEKNDPLAVDLHESLVLEKAPGDNAILSLDIDGDNTRSVLAGDRLLLIKDHDTGARLVIGLEYRKDVCEDIQRQVRRAFLSLADTLIKAGSLVSSARAIKAKDLPYYLPCRIVIIPLDPVRSDACQTAA